MFLLVIKLHIDMGLKAVLPGPQNALYVMLCMYPISEFFQLQISKEHLFE